MNNNPCRMVDVKHQSKLLMCDICKTIFNTIELFENHIHLESHLAKLKMGIGLCKYCKICRQNFYYNVITKTMEDHDNSHSHLWAVAIKVFGNHKVIANKFGLTTGPTNMLEDNPNFLGLNYVVKSFCDEEHYYLCYLCGFSPKLDAFSSEFDTKDPWSPIVNHLLSKSHLRNVIRFHVPRSLEMFDVLYAKEQSNEIHLMGHFTKVNHGRILKIVMNKLTKFIPPHLRANNKICYLDLTKCQPHFDMIAHTLMMSSIVLSEINLNKDDKGLAVKILSQSIKDYFDRGLKNGYKNNVNNSLIRPYPNSTPFEGCTLAKETITCDDGKRLRGPNVKESPFDKNGNSSGDQQPSFSGGMASRSIAIEDMVVLDEIGMLSSIKEDLLADSQSLNLWQKDPMDEGLGLRKNSPTQNMDFVRVIHEEGNNFVHKPTTEAPKASLYVRSKLGKDGKRTVVVKKIFKPISGKYRWRRSGYASPKHNPSKIAEPLGYNASMGSLEYNAGMNQRPVDKASELISSAIKRSQGPKFVGTDQDNFTDGSNEPTLSVTFRNSGHRGGDRQEPFHKSISQSPHKKVLVHGGNQRLLNEVFGKVREYVPGMPSVDMTKEDFTKEATVWRLLDVVSNIIKTLLTTSNDKAKFATHFDRLQKRYCERLMLDNGLLTMILKRLKYTLDRRNLGIGGINANHRLHINRRDLEMPVVKNFMEPTLPTDIMRFPKFGGLPFQPFQSSNPFSAPFPGPSNLMSPPPPYNHYNSFPNPMLPPSSVKTLAQPFSVLQGTLTPQARYCDESSQHFNNEVAMGPQGNNFYHETASHAVRSPRRGEKHKKKHKKYHSRRRHSRRYSSRSGSRESKHMRQRSRSRSPLDERHQEHVYYQDDQEMHEKLADHTFKPAPAVDRENNFSETDNRHETTSGINLDGISSDRASLSLEEIPDERVLLKRSLLSNRLRQLIELQKQSLAPGNGQGEDCMSIAVHLQTRLNDLVSDPGNATALHGSGGTEIKELLQEALRTQVKLLEKNNDRMREMESSHLAAQAAQSKSKEVAPQTIAPNFVPFTVEKNSDKASAAKIDRTTRVALKTGNTKRYCSENVGEVSPPPPSTQRRHRPLIHATRSETFHNYQPYPATKPDPQNSKRSADVRSKIDDAGVSHTTNLYDLERDKGESFHQAPYVSAFHKTQPPPAVQRNDNQETFKIPSLIPKYYTDKPAVCQTLPTIYDPKPVLGQYYTGLHPDDFFSRPPRPTLFNPPNPGNFTYN